MSLDTSRSTFKEFIKGNAPPKTMGIYFGITLVFYLMVILLARSTFPGGYDWLDYTISTQGGIADNPNGWWIYDGGIIIIGILLIPFHVYIYRRMQPTTLFLSRVILVFSLIGCIGFSLLGVFPHDIVTPHDIATSLAFGGFIMAAVLSFFVLIRKIQLHESWPSKRGFLLAYGHWWIMVGFIAILQNLDDWFDVSGFDPRYFHFPCSQWLAMVTVLIWMMGMYFNSYHAENNSIKSNK